jgi:hypothetical protein
LEQLEAVLAGEAVGAEAAHEGYVVVGVVQAVELVFFRVLLVEGLLPLPLEVDGAGEHQVRERRHRVWADDGRDQLVRPLRHPRIDLLLSFL